MNATRYNGLAGKARRVRTVSRAHRLYVQQLLDEYLEPEVDEAEPQRYIPIRNDYEFLPSADPAIDEPEPTLPAQLDLSQKPAADEVAAVAAPLPPQPIGVLRPRVTFTPVDHCRKRPRKLTAGGFAFGCAMGGAAAAVLLLVLQLAVG